MSKRTIDAFFKANSSTSQKRAKIETNDPNPPAEEQPQSTDDNGPPSTHPTYPFPIPNLPSHIAVGLTHSTPGCDPRVINNQPDLDLLYFQPYIPRRGSTETQITTPRYTTVFGIDDTAKFVEHPSTARTASTKAAHPVLVHAQTNQPIPTTPAPKYQYPPRPIPACLAHLQHLVQAATGSTYNFCLVNYYASAEDSISFHSDDERFLGAEPCIASLSLGGEREFLMKHKAAGKTGTQTGDPGLLAGASVKMGLGSGDMVVMRGRTQAHWLHSIPKRRGRNAEAIRGRINITFRRAVVPAGTNNYYHYNVGGGEVYRWDEGKRAMVLWSGD
ncbi:Oxoglutarate/iron-dependent dioxygenase [Penicillium chermesinum]|nr:Oxoglutarate/iron-dependent dioxygenase [Penicillium chermesinum]